ncbi:glycoside hydrolase family 78 protein [Clostridium fungisolvens]|uniref:alpha-L-rhamnosidase n=1 Tax=Clostridium fungisolvens TaxID=1604897 RepID=A0A6V8SN47_9CLOT|nr:glycoside hydrolase family 78 protein [Clostridium fungisolvens]GFP76598.1 Alpha-L-rhamnosidase [Clostridium fungisolvens]
MRVKNLRTNHITNPLGFELGKLRMSWITEDTVSKFQTAARVEIALDEAFENIVFDSGIREDIDSLAFYPEMKLSVRTRYFWRVTVWGDSGDFATSETAWFETAKLEEPWTAKWVTPSLDKELHPIIRKEFKLPSEVISARVYMCGLGLYEFEVNGRKASEEYFAPGFNAYDFWLQYQTYDITELLKEGDNCLSVMLGNGTYKGRYGFDGGYNELYGDKFALICEIVVTLKNGMTAVIGTDESWKAIEAPVKFSGVYDGEVYDANAEIEGWSKPGIDERNWSAVELIDIGYEKLTARLSLPVKIKEEIKPIEIIHTKKGETVLDMGQNMTGWIRFKASAEKGQELLLEFGEILQDDCFYRDNLRTAKAEFRYISDGTSKVVQPHFTYYGFRYVKLTGFKEVSLEDFTGCVIYSDLELTGSIETSNPLVNKLFKNAQWGQKGNFLDVPTDCPQRDEKMGWTGDAQVFASTACFNMYSPAFYTKYMYDLREEQKRLGGSVPFVVPSIKPKNPVGIVNGNGSTAWGDAATIIPWTLYLHYGDKELLAQQFDTMKDWVDYIKGIDDNTGGRRLWTVGFHFADWLALDAKNPAELTGGTDKYYIASAYYCYSAKLVAKASKILGKIELSEEYSNLAEEIKQAILREYFTPNGRSAINTQTAMIVALYMDLVPEDHRERTIKDLREKLDGDNMHLTTGFVGTPYFCRVLSENGSNEDAYRLLLNDDYPSWLYAVKLGATTIWERWNSVLPDGTIGDTGMNSLNHYAYGSIAEWMYRNMCGINPVEDVPGFRKIRLKPTPHGSLKYAKANFNSPNGPIESGWKLSDEGILTFEFEIPFNTTAELILPDALLENVKIYGSSLIESDIDAVQEGSNVVCKLTAGRYNFEYMPSKEYRYIYNLDNKLCELINNVEVKEILDEVIPSLVNNQVLSFLFQNTLKQISCGGMDLGIDWNYALNKIDSELKSKAISIL